MGDTLTYVDTERNWEILYINGEVEYENHAGRSWPGRVLDIIEEHDIDEVERLLVDDPEAYSAGALNTRDLDELRELAE